MRVTIKGQHIVEDQLKRGLYILIFSLSLSFACQELPELLSLSDDPTDDGTCAEYFSNRVHQLSPRPTPRRFESLDRKSPRSRDRKSTRLNSSHSQISYAVFCLKKKNAELFSDLHT